MEDVYSPCPVFSILYDFVKSLFILPHADICNTDTSELVVQMPFSAV